MGSYLRSSRPDRIDDGDLRAVLLRLLDHLESVRGAPCWVHSPDHDEPALLDLLRQHPQAGAVDDLERPVSGPRAYRMGNSGSTYGVEEPGREIFLDKAHRPSIIILEDRIRPVLRRK